MNTAQKTKTLTEAQLRYHADEIRLRGKRAALLELLLDGEWHYNHECANVGGISFHGSLHALRKLGGLIESHYLGPGRWMYRLNGRSNPKQMTGDQRRVAKAYVTAIAAAYGSAAVESVGAQVPAWMRTDDNAR